jgi:predicted acylesterase/phospholipase RssA
VLTIEAARRPRRSRRLAVALAGGGPLGAFYEIGALHALGEAIEGRELTELDVYVGVSSGALVAAGLANGFDTTAMGATYVRAELGTALPFSPGLLLQPAVGEYFERLMRLPEALTRATRQLARDPWQGGWAAALSSAGRLLPSAVFDNRPLERHLRALFGSPGHTDDFRALRRRLYVVATNLDTCASVAFGSPGLDRTPISRAVVASSALPGLYAPVRIDGEHYVDGALTRTMHASLALEEGCDLVIGINPLVPFDASRAIRGRRPSLASAGLPAILSQTFRALIYSRMQVGMAGYGERFPTADTLLIEPDRGDAQLFFTNVFRYSGRDRLVEYAYRRTRHDLLAQATSLAPLLERHGLGLNVAVLRDQRRRFGGAARERSALGRTAIARLNAELLRLERMLATASPA